MSRNRVLILVLAVFFALSTVNAGAQVRLDANVPWLLMAGFTLEALTGDPETASVDLSQWHIPLPHLALTYQFGGDFFIKGGVGLRIYPLIVEFAGWPIGYVELELKPVVLRAELGGLAFFAIGILPLPQVLYCDEYTLKVLIPDISAEFAFTDWFRAGLGVNMFAPFGNLNNFGWLFYINGRFTFLFRDKD
jgi:hypothetical protein